MSDWQGRFREFFLKYLQEEEGYERAEEVRGIQQVVRDGGFCETCSYEYEVIIFEYREGDRWDTAEVGVSFTDLFSEE